MVTSQNITTWLSKAAALFEEQEQHLTTLDAAIGDADHGINLNRGFSKVRAQLPALARDDPAEILKAAGMTLIGSVGGASGPLYGTFFVDGAKPLSGKKGLDGWDLALLFESGLAGILRIGRGAPGEKTMIDSLTPALEAMKASLTGKQDIAKVTTAAAKAAREGMLKTIPMTARRGRASYLGERSVGHQDPGATSMYLLIKALADTVAQSEGGQV
jgi:dihydroxyacetone kinase-like protein